MRPLVFTASLGVALGAALLASAVLVFAQGGVLPPEGGFAERATHIGQGGLEWDLHSPTEAFAQHVSQNLPADDRGRFHLAVAVGRNDDSDLLLRDLENHAALKQMAEWCKKAVYREGTPTGDDWMKANQITRTPFIAVFPHEGDPRYPYEAAYKQWGYRGDADLLARDLHRNIASFVQRHNPTARIEQYCPPNRPCPQPNTPSQPNQPYAPNNDWNTPALPAHPSVNPVPISWDVQTVLLIAVVGVVAWMLWQIQSAATKAAKLLLVVSMLTVAGCSPGDCCFAQEIEPEGEADPPAAVETVLAEPDAGPSIDPQPAAEDVVEDVSLAEDGTVQAWIRRPDGSYAPVVLPERLEWALRDEMRSVLRAEARLMREGIFDGVRVVIQDVGQIVGSVSVWLVRLFWAAVITLASLIGAALYFVRVLTRLAEIADRFEPTPRARRR